MKLTGITSHVLLRDDGSRCAVIQFEIDGVLRTLFSDPTSADSARSIADTIVGALRSAIDEHRRTIRDEFAMAAMKGLLANPHVKQEVDSDRFYQWADSMLAAREKGAG